MPILWHVQLFKRDERYKVSGAHSIISTDHPPLFYIGSFWLERNIYLIIYIIFYLNIDKINKICSIHTIPLRISINLKIYSIKIMKEEIFLKKLIAIISTALSSMKFLKSSMISSMNLFE